MGTKMIVRSSVLHIFHFILTFLRTIFHYVNILMQPFFANYSKPIDTLSSDSKSLRKLPRHLGIVVVEDELCCSDIARITVWCIALGISYITIYDRSGVCKKNHLTIQNDIDLQLAELKHHENIRKSQIHIATGLEKPLVSFGCHPVFVRILSMTDSRKQLVSLAQEMSTAVFRQSMKLSEIEPSNVDNLLLEKTGLPDLDLVIRFGATDSLMGLAPWQIRLTEFLSYPTHRGIAYSTVYQLIDSYGNTEQRFGK